MVKRSLIRVYDIRFDTLPWPDLWTLTVLLLDFITAHYRLSKLSSSICY